MTWTWSIVRERYGANGLLISSFNGKPQASAFMETVACGLPLNENLIRVTKSTPRERQSAHESTVTRIQQAQRKLCHTCYLPGALSGASPSGGIRSGVIISRY